MKNRFIRPTPIRVSSANPGATKATGPSMLGGDWANIRLEGGVVALKVRLRPVPDLCVSMWTVLSLGDTKFSLLYLTTCPSSWFSPRNKENICFINVSYFLFCTGIKYTLFLSIIGNVQHFQKNCFQDFILVQHNSKSKQKPLSLSL